jgi:hypothetical protein
MKTVQLSLRQGRQDICLSNEIYIHIQFCYENEIWVALEICITSNPNDPVLLHSPYIGNTSTRVRHLYGRNEHRKATHVYNKQRGRQ